MFLLNRNQKKEYKFSDFISNYLYNLGGASLANLFLFFGIFIFVCFFFLFSYYSKTFNIFVLFLFFPVTSPLFAGAFYIARKLTEKKEIHALADFKKGMKDNWKAFFINSVMIYIISLGLFWTYSFYRGNINNTPMTIVFVMTLIFTFFFLCMEFSILTMMVSVELSVGDMIKNAVMLVIMGFWNHLKTIFALLFIGFMVFVVAQVTGSVWGMMIVIAVLSLLFLPMLISYLIIFNGYQLIEKTVIKTYQENHSEKMTQKQATPEISFEKEELKAFSEGDPEEYIYLNGKMIKRKEILKILEKKY